MRLALAFLPLAACNQIFGLAPTQGIDASQKFFDAPVDSPFSCPPLGSTPAFSTLLHQDVAQYCYEYTIVPGRDVAMALCYDENYASDVYEGPRDAPLTNTVPGFSVATYYLQDVTFGPEGDYALVEYEEIITVPTTVVQWRLRQLSRGADGIWRPMGTDEIFMSPPAFSAPTRGPNRHMFRSDYASLTELSLINGTWTAVATYTGTDLGTTSASSPRVSADGLRLLFAGAPAGGGSMQHEYYSDRTSIDARFRKADMVQGLPTLSDPYLSEDCSRVYFSGLQSVFYAQQL